MRITVEIPDELARQIVSLSGDPDCVGKFCGRVLSCRQNDNRTNTQLLGFDTRMHVDTFLQEHQVYDYTVEDLEKDLATLERLEGKRAEPSR